MPDPASLQNLHDIIMPPPVSWWPPAPGWYVVLGLLIGCLFVLAIQAFISYRRNAYRRAALDELQSADEGSDKIGFISALLKRTALSAYPREQVASLTGKAWVRWLSEAAGLDVSAPVREALQHGVYGGIPVTDTQALTDFAAQWIRRHRGVR
jgi:hypothetical protein